MDERNRMGPKKMGQEECKKGGGGGEEFSRGLRAIDRPFASQAYHNDKLLSL